MLCQISIFDSMSIYSYYSIFILVPWVPGLSKLTLAQNTVNNPSISTLFDQNVPDVFLKQTLLFLGVPHTFDNPA